MKTKLLRRLRKKWRIVTATIHVIKEVYSLKPLSYHQRGNPHEAEWFCYQYKQAVERQRMEILKEARK